MLPRPRAACRRPVPYLQPLFRRCCRPAAGLARYAQIAQQNGLVPIVEPEVRDNAMVDT